MKESPKTVENFKIKSLKFMRKITKSNTIIFNINIFRAAENKRKNLIELKDEFKRKHKRNINASIMRDLFV